MINMTGQGGSVTNPNTGNNPATTYTAGTAKKIRVSRTGQNTTFPAGAYFVQVTNTGFSNITVNGETISPNQKWSSNHNTNRVDTIQDFTEEVIIIATGSESYAAMASYPSNSNIDLSTI